jgi:26S proteasome non-ATPase regulatory subunit 10
MIASSLKDAAGDAIIEILLKKGADVSIKSNSGQVRVSGEVHHPTEGI